MTAATVLSVLLTWQAAAAIVPAAGGGRSGSWPLDQNGAPQRWLQTLYPDYLALSAKGAVAHPVYVLPLAGGGGQPLERADTGYVDLDSAFPDQLLDYNCGNRTYDLASGYNHQGVDYGLWPYWWHQMDAGTTEVIAAAAGTLVFKEDGHYDRQCSFNSEVPNFVGVQHGDGSIALYFHLKLGSLTTKAIGMPVTQGEYLGLVGSSGSSVIPHLHLETYYPGAGGPDTIVEPHSGPCNLPADSWWLAQEPYLRPAIVRVATHDVAPTVDNVFPRCAIEQDPHYQDFFDPGQPVYFAIYFRDAAEDDAVDITVYNPDGSEWDSFQLVIDADLRLGWWAWGPWQLAEVGWHRAVVTFQGTDSEHLFFVGFRIFEDGFE